MTWLYLIADATKVGCHLPRQHFEITSAPQSGCQSGVADRLQRHWASAFIDGAANGPSVAALERDEVEPVCHDERVCDEVAAAAHELIWTNVATQARIRVRTRHAVERARAGKLSRSIR